MSKKYLLYIHNDKFKDEEEKSSLVNSLLDRHYATGQVASDKRPTPETPQRTLSNVLGEIKDLERERDEELMYIQDPLEGRQRESEYRKLIEALWVEYHDLKQPKPSDILKP